MSLIRSQIYSICIGDFIQFKLPLFFIEIKLSLNSKDSFSSLDLDASLNDIKADLKMPVLFIKICLSIVSTYVILFHMSEEQLFYITILYHPQISVICV